MCLEDRRGARSVTGLAPVGPAEEAREDAYRDTASQPFAGLSERRVISCSGVVGASGGY